MLNKIKNHHLPAVYVLSTLISVASAAERVQPSHEADEAFEQGDFAKSYSLLSSELQECEAKKSEADQCLNLMFAASNSARKGGKLIDAEVLARAAMETALAVLGEQHPDTARSYNIVALNLNAEGRYADAEPLYRKALEIRQAVLGVQHPDTATSYNNLAVNLTYQGHYADAEPLNRKALEIQQALLGEQHPATASSYDNLAGILSLQGHFDAAEPLYRKALEIRQAVLGEQHPDTASSYSNVAGNLNAQGHYADAEFLRRKALEIRQAVLGEQHPHTAMSYFGLASDLQDQGHFADAEPLYRKGLEIRRAVLGEQHPETALSYSGLASSLNEQGRYTDAEPLYRKGLEIRQAVLGEQHPETAGSYYAVAYNLFMQGRYADAGPLYRKALEIRQAVLGEQHPATAASYNSVASNLRSQGQHADAELLYRKALEIRQAVLGEQHPATAASYNNVAFILRSQGRFDEAEPLFRKTLEIAQVVLGERHPDTASTYNNLASNLNAQGRYDEAARLLHKGLEIRQAVLGEQHPDTAVSYSDLGSFYADRGNVTEALSYARQAALIVRRQQGHGQQAQARRLSGGSEISTSRHAYAAVLKAAWLGTQDLKSADMETALMNESFTAVQDLIANGTEAAVTQMAARFSAGDDGLAQLSRQHQDTARELSATDALILTAWGDGNTEQAETLKGRSEALTERLAILSSDLRDRYPSYAELVLPEPLSIAETQASLADGQGLLVIVPWGKHTYVFALTTENAQWQRIDLSRRELSRRAARLRCDFDPATCSDDVTERTRAGASAYGESVSRGLRPFDRSTAYSIYRDVLLPVIDVFEDIDSLSVVTSGPLGGVPLSVLVTEEPGAGEDDADPEVLRDTAWLGDRFALMSLPSVSSLESLGGIDETFEEDREVFVGVGDPLLGGELVADTSRGGLDQYFRGTSDLGTALANPESLRELTSLPGTRSELEAMAQALGVPEDSLLLGEDATETAVKASTLSTEVLTFATHGLIAGELRGLGEPGLVLTPPEEATEHDDGILTASEVARLDMDVEWLILSACNTAAADGTPGAEGLSGLARAFLYAGARSLLVSHWRVRDDVTARLTVAAIEGASDQSRSKSLQQAMRSIRTGTDQNGDVIPGWDPSWSHPAAWAPFSLVGARP